MKRIFVLFLIMAVTIVNAAELKLGKAITLKEKLTVSDVLQNTAKLEGKTVLIEGTILTVCTNKGCWIEVAGENTEEKIKVKVEDGVIVFPQESKGKLVTVEGVVEEVTAKNSCGDHKNEAKNDKAEVKEKSACGGCSGDKAKAEGSSCGSDKGTASAKKYQIKGLGAVIK
ncbi:MAG: hypothetical protein FD143_2550 [Ignavibacteria bacterium]|nr:MAG: hypothetical protein FD143_2550 [Ignavibacteria bacterium]KAF0156394.1 MAG: hypothetical protein FD188_2964 [Ignavibacteria bacterium]